MPIKVLIVGHIVATASSRPDAELVLGLNGLGVEIDAALPADSYYTEVFKKAGIRVINVNLNKKISPGNQTRLA